MTSACFPLSFYGKHKKPQAPFSAEIYVSFSWKGMEPRILPGWDNMKCLSCWSAWCLVLIWTLNNKLQKSIVTLPQWTRIWSKMRGFLLCLMTQYPQWCQWFKVRIWSMLTLSSQCFHINKWYYEEEVKSRVISVSNPNLILAQRRCQCCATQRILPEWIWTLTCTQSSASAFLSRW